MAMEMVCGNCQGRLMVEQSGVVVACPHCGAHLQIGEAPPPPFQPQPDYSQPQYAPSNYPPQNYPYPNYPQQYPPYYAPQSPDQLQQPPQQQFPQHPYPQYQPPAESYQQSAPTPTPEPAMPPQSFAPPQMPAPAQPGPSEHNWQPHPAEHQPSPPESAASKMSETTEFRLPANSGAIAPQPEGDAWLPNIDVSMPEPIKPVVPVNTPPEETVAQVPAVTSAAVPLPSIDQTPPPKVVFGAAPTPVVSKSPPTEIWSAAQVPSAPPSPPATSFPAAAPAVAQPLSPPTHDVAQVSAALPDFSGFGGQASSSAPAAIPTLEITAGHDDFAGANASASPVGGGPAISTSNGPHPAVVSKQMFIIVASYASAMTLGFIYLWLKMMNGSALDLPDRKPEFRRGQVGISIYPDGPLPSSHRIRLGESKQFGSLRITPVKVTKGNLQFEHHLAGGNLQRPGTTSPVLKLWMKFENVSSDQTFPALDEDLVYLKFRDRSNNYLCMEKDLVPKGRKIPVYDWPVNSEWLMKGQKLDTPLRPGETWETYIPTNDERDIEALQGPLAWRVHFRKGYNRGTYRGVTTIVEVDFDTKDIQADS
jgi:hypothetical protein